MLTTASACLIIELEEIMDYGFVKKTDLQFEGAVKKTDEELQKEGFKILTTIDVQTKFKEKLNIDFPKYVILGACNPKLAHDAISAEWDIGLLLPCNVVVYEKDDKVWVGVMKPTAAMAAVHNESLRGLAAEVESKLKRVFDGL
jgi:uncharacterized protein (DUF302 family)